MDDIQPADIRLMRNEGSLRDFLRLQMTNGKARNAPAKPPPPPQPSDHTPGAWPTGSRPPRPIPQAPPGAWEAALHRLHTDTQTGTRCECPGCDPTTGSHPDAA
ncbi:hypothetical protein ABT024_07090 [Streptomyces sp. NPDC002812]|uniref:hypothetical protein n=1 Tax=Streptomyces sp. NPDC002812 TaxID=3154434 RepID=UPI00332AD6D9